MDFLGVNSGSLLRSAQKLKSRHKAGFLIQLQYNYIISWRRRQQQALQLEQQLRQQQALEQEQRQQQALEQQGQEQQQQEQQLRLLELQQELQFCHKQIEPEQRSKRRGERSVSFSFPFSELRQNNYKTRSIDKNSVNRSKAFQDRPRDYNNIKE